MCYSKATKWEITHVEYWEKNMYESHVYTATTTKNIHHIEYWKESTYNGRGNSTTSCQKLIKFLNHHVDNEAINAWLNYILELIRTKAGLLLAYFS